METLVKKAKAKIKAVKNIILTVKEYSKAKRIDANREINPAHVEDMKESVMRNGILRDVILGMLNGVLVIIDGQHLFEALKQLGVSVPCKVVECKNKAEMVQLMIDLNTTSKGWSLPEYIDSWAWLGNPDYKFLKEAMKNELTIKKQIKQETVILMAYAQNANRTALTRATKNGEFKVADAKAGSQLLKQVVECNKFISPSRPTNQALITLMIEEGKSYNHAKFMKGLKNSSLVVEANAERKEGLILVHLKDIYRGK